MNSNPRRQLLPRARLTPVCLLSLVFTLSHAQVAPATEAAPDVPAPETPTEAKGPLKEQVVILSPFEVRSERDSGFVAASALSGGRLATELKDTPVAYSVLTRDFLDALNLHDTQDALAWAVNAYSTPDSGTDKIQNLDAGVNTRSRGISVTGVQRNFFLLGVNSDTYSQERIDFARGPNALLVGNSQIGGSIISMTKRARTDKAFSKFTSTAGSWENYRATVDVNLPLIKDKLAVRANVLWQDSASWRDWVFDNRKGIHLAATYRPFRRTEIRLESEFYQQDTLQTLSTLNDRVSGWDGVTVVNAPTATVSNSSTAGISRLGSSTAQYPVYIPGYNSGTVVNYANTWMTIGGGETTTTKVGGVQPVTTTNLGVAGASITSDQNLPDARFDLAGANSFFRTPGREFVISPNTPTAAFNFKDMAGFIEQQIGKHVFLEAASNFAQTQRKTEYIVTRGIADARIDINRTLPTGEANPFYLEPYGEAANGHTYFKNNIWDTRVAAAVVFDNTPWGSFRANVIAGDRWNEQRISQYADVMERNADPRQRAVQDIITYRYYWNDTSRPFILPDSVTYVDPVAKTSQSYKVRQYIDLRNPGNTRKSETEFTYLQSTLNARLFKNRLHLTGGVRRDRFQVTSSALTSRPANDYPSNWDGTTILYKPQPPSNYYDLTYTPKNATGAATGTALPASARPRDSSGNPLQQYANDRFRDDYSSPTLDYKVTSLSYGGVVHVFDWLSTFANYAETFNPSIAGQTITGNLLPPQLSHGWDVGVRLTFLAGRLSTSLGRYGSVQNNSGFDSGSATATIGTIVNANVVGDQSLNGMNTRGLTAVPSPTFDFQQTNASGYELDVVANLTPDWRLTLNYGKPEAYTTGRYSDLYSYLGANEPTLKQVLLDAGGLVDPSNVATIDQTVPVANRSPDISAAVNAWNSLQTFKRSNDPSATSRQTRLLDYTANIYTDYRIRAGWLKNLRIGAGVQFRGRTSIGNRAADTIVNPANPLQAIDDPTVDATTPVYMPAYHVATFTLGYTYRLKKGKGPTLGLDLRVSNLFDEDRLIYIGTGLRPLNGDVTSPARVATPNSFHFIQPRSYSLTASIKF